MSRRYIARLLTLAALLAPPACTPSTGVPTVSMPSSPPILYAVPSAHGLQIGEHRTVRAILADGTEPIGPIAIAAHATIDHPAVAHLEGDALVGVARGTTTLRINYAGAALEVPVVVTDADPVSLAIEAPGAPRLGERVLVRAIVHYGDGTVGDATLDADWSTATRNRLAVANTPETRGAVVAILPKPATLIARFGGLEARTQIAPVGGEPSGIEVRLAWSYGEHRRFGAFAHWTDGETREVSAGCLWRVPGEGAFRGVDRAHAGPWVPVTALSWDRIATCELATTSASGSLFAP